MNSDPKHVNENQKNHDLDIKPNFRIFNRMFIYDLTNPSPPDEELRTCNNCHQNFKGLCHYDCRSDLNGDRVDTTSVLVHHNSTSDTSKPLLSNGIRGGTNATAKIRMRSDDDSTIDAVVEVKSSWSPDRTKSGHTSSMSPVKSKGNGNYSMDRTFQMREHKTTKRLAIVVGFFIFCWCPFFVAYVMTPFVAKGVIPTGLYDCLTWLGK